MAGNLLFAALSSVVVASALWVVVSKNLIHAAVSLLITLFGIAGLYVFLYADFIAATQIMVYVGGILVLIIFGVMLTNKIDRPSIATSSRNQLIGMFVSTLIFAFQMAVIFKTNWKTSESLDSSEETVRQIGELLLTTYLLPFEIASVLLLSALVGAALLSRKEPIKSSYVDSNKSKVVDTANE